MTEHTPNAFALVRPPAKPLPPERQAKDHPRKRGADILLKKPRTPKKGP